jgi:regulator of sirC expression with transglutaminase-like and TPR domain
MQERPLTENEIKALVSLLGDSDPEVVAHVEERLASLGESAIPLLEKEWEENFDPGSQKRIENLIHSLQFEQLHQRLVHWFEEGSNDLLEGLWLLATYKYPELDFNRIKDLVQQIYYEAWLEFKPDIEALDQIKILNSVIFNKLKFAPNTDNFHSIDNSMMNVVLENRRGNPISLCCLYLLVAQKMKLPVFGVNLPNLFILTYKGEGKQFYINVFNKGLIFSRQDIDQYLLNLRLEKNDIFYEPCSHSDIIRRMLRNMMLAYEKAGESERQEEINILLNSISNEEDLPD